MSLSTNPLFAGGAGVVLGTVLTAIITGISRVFDARAKTKNLFFALSTELLENLVSAEYSYTFMFGMERPLIFKKTAYENLKHSGLLHKNEIYGPCVKTYLLLEQTAQGICSPGSNELKALVSDLKETYDLVSRRVDFLTFSGKVRYWYHNIINRFKRKRETPTS